MARKSFAVFDSDSHVVEPPELWTKYLEPEYRTLGKYALWREEGKWGSYLQINGKVFRDTMNSNIPRHAIWRPGLSWRQIGELDPGVRHPMTAGGSDPEARLNDMDAMGVDQAFLYPTWFAEGFHLVENPDVAYALARAYNNWIADFCAAAPGRLFAAAMLPLQHMDYALEELKRVRSITCFRAAFLRPMFIEGRYFTHPYYNPLWDELERMGMAAAVHPTAGLWNPEWTSHGPFIPLLHHYPVRTDTEELWDEGKVMLGFDAEERMVQRLPQNFVAKIVWGSRYPQHDTTSAWDAIDKLTRANIDEAMIARMMSGNAAAQFGVELERHPEASI